MVHSAVLTQYERVMDEQMDIGPQHIQRYISAIPYVLCTKDDSDPGDLG